MDNGIRIGKVSSIDYQNGMIKVVYEDRDDSVTDDMPVLNMNGEYKMPKIDDMVLVLHLSNGPSVGVVLGTFWSESNNPIESGKGIYRKELSNTPGEAYIKYDEVSKRIIIKANEVELQTLNGNTLLGGI